MEQGRQLEHMQCGLAYLTGEDISPFITAPFRPEIDGQTPDHNTLSAANRYL